MLVSHFWAVAERRTTFPAFWNIFKHTIATSMLRLGQQCGSLRWCYVTVSCSASMLKCTVRFSPLVLRHSPLICVDVCKCYVNVQSAWVVLWSVSVAINTGAAHTVHALMDVANKQTIRQAGFLRFCVRSIGVAIPLHLRHLASPCVDLRCNTVDEG